MCVCKCVVCVFIGSVASDAEKSVKPIHACVLVHACVMCVLHLEHEPVPMLNVLAS